LEYIKSLEKENKKVIFCGDINTCHHEIDIARPKENEGKIGFHIEEREYLTQWENSGWKDIWRFKNKEVKNQYSWWSYRGGARDRNVGWRIDYFFIPEILLNDIKDIKYLNNQKGSDHCPIILDLCL
jgi:exodeoxyribonuclease-3